jgi:hypothetical protein
MMVGNKLDLVQKGVKQRAVNFKEAQQLCESLSGINVRCIETSAMEKTGVEDAYE